MQPCPCAPHAYQSWFTWALVNMMGAQVDQTVKCARGPGTCRTVQPPPKEVAVSRGRHLA